MSLEAKLTGTGNLKQTDSVDDEKLGAQRTVGNLLDVYDNRYIRKLDSQIVRRGVVADVSNKLLPLSLAIGGAIFGAGTMNPLISASLASSGYFAGSLVGFFLKRRLKASERKLRLREKEARINLDYLIAENYGVDGQEEREPQIVKIEESNKEIYRVKYYDYDIHGNVNNLSSLRIYFDGKSIQAKYGKIVRAVGIYDANGDWLFNSKKELSITNKEQFYSLTNAVGFGMKGMVGSLLRELESRNEDLYDSLAYSLPEK